MTRGQADQFGGVLALVIYVACILVFCLRLWGKPAWGQWMGCVWLLTAFPLLYLLLTAPTLGRPPLYMLQVGSFNQRSDAERLKAELALLGEVAHIENVTVNERSMHRVRLGPYRSARKLSAVKNRLSALDVPTMALKLRKEE